MPKKKSTKKKSVRRSSKKSVMKKTIQKTARPKKKAASKGGVKKANASRQRKKAELAQTAEAILKLGGKRRIKSPDKLTTDPVGGFVAEAGGWKGAMQVLTKLSDVMDGVESGDSKDMKKWNRFIKDMDD